MTLLRPHPHRLDLLAANEALDPVRDHEAVYRTVVLHEFPWDYVTSLNLAFYRVFAAPRMAALLTSTGEMEARPDKRAEDTGLLMFELIAGGLHSDRGREVIRAMNRMHRRWPIEGEDYRYVLAAFVVVPTRWIAAYGWRPLTPNETAATVAFYRALGRLMGITGFPDDYQAIAALFDDYEQRHLRYTPAAARLLAATRGVLADRLPEPARFLTGPLLRVILDRQMCRAFGIRPAGRPLQDVFAAALAARRAVLRRQPPRTDPWFRPGRSTRVYPTGYQLASLGVADHATPHPGHADPGHADPRSPDAGLTPTGQVLSRRRDE